MVDEIADEFGSQCTVVAVDARRSRNTECGFEVFTHGGRSSTGFDLVEWVTTAVERGAGEILLTSMDHDGTRDGFDLEMLQIVNTVLTVPLVASGGVGTLDHLVEGARDGRADAVLAASIFHFGDYTVKEAKQCLMTAGIQVRPVG